MPDTKELTGAVRRASREIVRELGFMENSVFGLGVTHSQCHALLEMEQAGTLGTLELSSLLRLDKSTTSRLMADLLKRGLATAGHCGSDGRRKPLLLTLEGRRLVGKIHDSANRQVENALSVLSLRQRSQVLRGISLYAKALALAARDSRFSMRPIIAADNSGMEAVMRRVMVEFGVKGPGCSVNDAELSNMHSAYSKHDSAYFVLLLDGQVVGGAGIAPLRGGAPDTCEFKKMYFLPQARGLGFGRKLLDECLCVAKNKGYKYCYLETLGQMRQAQRLYRKSGFRKLRAPLGQTGHFSCHEWYLKKLF